MDLKLFKLKKFYEMKFQVYFFKIFLKIMLNKKKEKSNNLVELKSNTSNSKMNQVLVIFISVTKIVKMLWM